MKVFDYNYYITKPPLSNFDILQLVNQMNNKRMLKNFKGVFMRNEISGIPKLKECGIINLDDKENKGTHWVCYFIFNSSIAYYFDSFGLYPPIELQNYLKEYNIIGSNFQLQDFNTNYCGYYCLYILELLSLGFDYEKIVIKNNC